MKKIALSLILLTALIIVSCGEEGPKPPEAGKLVSYTDEATGFEINYPENWNKYEIAGKQFQAISIGNAKDRFLQYDTEGLPVAKVSMTLIVLDSTQDMQTAVDTSYYFPKEYYSAPVDFKIDGTVGKKLTYEFPLTDGLFNGELYIATKDGILYHIIKIEAFAGTIEKYRKTFDDILSSIKLGVKPELAVATSGETEDLPPPSSTLKTVKGNGYSIRIPDNFSATNSGGRTIYSGERRGDSYVSVSTSTTSSKNLKGTAEKNAKSVGASGATKLTLGGKEAYKVSYSPNSAIHRDMYYVINDGKFYQIVVDYYKKEAELYKNILTKSAKSIKF
ncbi:MAG: hypothetical protein ACE364_04080 [Chlorobiota bacterium]